MISRTVLVAPDAFKGTLAASEVAGAVAQGLEAAGWPAPDRCPVADGGEGTLDVLLEARGGTSVAVAVSDPLGRAIDARLGLLDEGALAVVEVAQASGLELVAEAERDPEAASTRGTGELIVAAVRSGAATVLVAAGGSATTDGGLGAIEAIEAGGGLKGARLVVLCDVRSTFEEAAMRFAPQKGADDDAVIRLAARLEQLARCLPRDPRGQSMSAAAGGLAGGLWATYGARLHPGAAFVLGALDFDARLRRARAVVVGEGCLDVSTLEGKAAAEIATRARQTGVPCHAIVGRDELDPFDARILDLGVILTAGNLDALKRAGRALGRLI